MAWAKIIKKESRKIYKERQNAYKEEDQYIIIRWKGGKMKEDAVSQCPSRRMDTFFGYCILGFERLLKMWFTSVRSDR